MRSWVSCKDAKEKKAPRVFASLTGEFFEYRVYGVDVFWMKKVEFFLNAKDAGNAGRETQSERMKKLGRFGKIILG